MDKRNTFKGLCLRGFLVVFSLFLNLSLAMAQQQDWIYIVTKDDTLWDLSKKYLPSVTYWQKFQKLNGITYPKRIKPGTRLRIPLAWLSDQAVPAKVIAVNGDVKLTSGQTHIQQGLTSGALIHLGDLLQTGSSASAAVEFADGSILTIRQDTTLAFDHLSAYSDTGMVDTRLRLTNGRVDIRAKPAAGPGSRFEIHTPAAVSAVRGTQYRAAAQDAEKTSWVEVLEGKVAATGGATTTLVPAEFGTRVVLGEPPLPPRPLLEAPLLNPLPEKIQRLNWPLTWEAVKHAERYHIEVSSQSDFSLVLWERTTESARTPLPDLADGEYFVRVRGIDALGLEGLNRMQQLELDARPQPPAPLEPADGAVLRGEAPKLRWTDSAEATSYRLQIAMDDGFADLATDQHNLAASSFEPPELSPGKYFWRLASISSTGEQGPFGPSRSLELKPVPATPLTALTADEEKVRASWQAGAAGQSYQVQIAEDPEFRILLLDEPVATPEIEIPQLAGLVRYLRVRIVEPDGYLGPWGAVQQIDPLPDHGWLYVILSGILGFILL